MPNFRFALKQGGGMLAKGRLLGVQFGALLEDDLWLALGRRENQLAARLTQGLQAKGYAFYRPVPHQPGLPHPDQNANPVPTDRLHL